MLKYSRRTHLRVQIAVSGVKETKVRAQDPPAITPGQTRRLWKAHTAARQGRGWDKPPQKGKASLTRHSLWIGDPPLHLPGKGDPSGASTEFG